MDLEPLTTVCLVTLLALAVAFDVATRRIPNVLTVGGVLVALLLRAPEGFEALGAGGLGALLAFALALPWFLAGGLGGGDVKLLAALGAFLGPASLLPALVVTALAGAVLALAAALRQRAAGRVARNIGLIVATLGRRTFTGWKGAAGEAPLTMASPGAVTIPYGVAIALGGVVGWFFT